LAKKNFKGVSAIIMVIAAIIIRIFFFEIYKIPSTSMVPTLIPGDYPGAKYQNLMYSGGR
jgi:signal peptidase I